MSHLPMLHFMIKFLVSQARNHMLYLSLFEILGRMDLSQPEAYRAVRIPLLTLFQQIPEITNEPSK